MSEDAFDNATYQREMQERTERLRANHGQISYERALNERALEELRGIALLNEGNGNLRLAALAWGAYLHHLNWRHLWAFELAGTFDWFLSHVELDDDDPVHALCARNLERGRQVIDPEDERLLRARFEDLYARVRQREG